MKLIIIFSSTLLGTALASRYNHFLNVYYKPLDKHLENIIKNIFEYEENDSERFFDKPNVPVPKSEM